MSEFKKPYPADFHLITLDFEVNKVDCCASEWEILRWLNDTSFTNMRLFNHHVIIMNIIIFDDPNKRTLYVPPLLFRMGMIMDET